MVGSTDNGIGCSGLVRDEWYVNPSSSVCVLVMTLRFRVTFLFGFLESERGNGFA